MNHWFIQIENRNNREKLSIYDDGTVYGTERGNKLFVLKEEAINKIKKIIKENEYMLKKEIYVRDHWNNYNLRLYDNNLKHRNIKAVGWAQTDKILNIIKNPRNMKNKDLYFKER